MHSFGYSANVANALCRQLGLPLPARLVDNAVFGPGSGPVLLSRIECSASAARLEQCQYELNTLQCGHDRDVGLICNAQPSKAINCVISLPALRDLQSLIHDLLDPCSPVAACGRRAGPLRTPGSVSDAGRVGDGELVPCIWLQLIVMPA